MRIRGRLISAIMERETSDFYELGSINPVSMPALRTRMRIEIEVDYHEGGFSGAGEIVDLTIGEEGSVPVRGGVGGPSVGGVGGNVRISAGRAAADNPAARRAMESIQNLTRAIEETNLNPFTVTTATPEQLDNIARDIGMPPRNPDPPKPEPEPEKPKTRWGLLEID